MSKLKISNRFAVTPNELLNDKRISYKAKGLYGLMQSKPDGWEFSLERLTTSTDKIDSVRKGVNELIEFGWLTRTRTYNEKGYAKYDYELNAFPNLENPTFENPTYENPTFENPTTYKERVLQKKNNTKKEIKNIECTFSENPANAPRDLFGSEFSNKTKRNCFADVDFESIKQTLISCTGKKIRVVNEKAKRQFNARAKEGYLLEDILSAIQTASKNDYHISTEFRYLTMEFFSRADIIDKYSTPSQKTEKETQHNIVRGKKGNVISINGILRENWSTSEWNIHKSLSE